MSLSSTFTSNCTERKSFHTSRLHQQQLNMFFQENLPAQPELTGVSSGKKVRLFLSIWGNTNGHKCACHVSALNDARLKHSADCRGFLCPGRAAGGPARAAAATSWQDNFSSVFPFARRQRSPSTGKLTVIILLSAGNWCLRFRAFQSREMPDGISRTD